MPTEEQLLFAILAFEGELIDLHQLTSACRAWASDKSKPLADQLVDRGWVTTDDKAFLEKQAQRKIARHQNDPRATLNSVTRGDVCNLLLKEVDDSEVQQSLSSWPSDAPVLVETIGETLDESQQPKTRYTWVSEVGAGGLGRVWLARDNNLSREVAVKEIKPGSASSEAVRRLIKEAQITGQLQHPGIVPVYEVSHEGHPFYTMKLVRGETLSHAIRKHHEQKQAGHEDTLTDLRLLNVFLNVCDAIAYAHSRGVIHRDLKPENVVLGDYGEAIVLDWGLAKTVHGADEDSPAIVVTEDALTEATRGGATPGTPAYMSPEQARGRIDLMDARTDIYGLGAILFEILTGQPPHKLIEPEATTDGNVLTPPARRLLKQIDTEATPHVRDRDSSISEELDAVCARAMSKSRDDRYESAKELKAAILEYQVHEESIDLSARAAIELFEALRSQSYDSFSRARFGFEQAIQLWPENQKAQSGLLETCLEFARCAQSKGDFDLGLSLLDSKCDEHKGLSQELEAAKKTVLEQERQLAEQQLARAALKKTLTTTAVAALCVVSVLAGYSELQRREAVTQRSAAEANAATALKNEEKEKKANRQLGQANKDLAKSNEELALKTKEANDLAEQEHIARTEAEEQLNASRIAAYTAQLLRVGALSEKQPEEALKILNDVRLCPPDLRDFTWGYYFRQCHRNYLTMRHYHRDWKVDAAQLSVVRLSPNGRHLASAGDDPYVDIWDITDGRRIHSLRMENPAVIDVAFSRDGKSVLTAGRDGTVVSWNLASGKMISSAAAPIDLTDSYRPVFALSRDAVQAAAVDTSGKIIIWNPETGAIIRTLNGDLTSQSEMQIRFSPDNNLVGLVASRYKNEKNDQVQIWDIGTGIQRLSLDLPATGDVFEFSSDSQGFIVKLVDRSCAFIDIQKQEQFPWPERPLFPDTGSAGPVAVSSAANIFALSQREGLAIFDVATGIQKAILSDRKYTCLEFVPDGSVLVTGDISGHIRLWDLSESHKFAQISGVGCHAISPDGKNIAHSAANSMVVIRERQNGRVLGQFPIQSKHITCISYSPDGMNLAVGTSGTTIFLVEAETGESEGQFELAAGFASQLLFTPDGGRLIAVNAEVAEPITIWSTHTREVTDQFDSHPGQLGEIAISPNGRLLAATHSISFEPNDGKEYQTVRLWDTITGMELEPLKSTNYRVNCLTFSPDGATLASGAGNTITLWDVPNRSQIKTLIGRDRVGHLQKIVFSADGLVLAAQDWEVITLWDTTNGLERATLKDAGSVNKGVLSFTPDSTQLIHTDFSGLSIWESHVGSAGSSLRDDKGTISSVAVSPDGKIAATVTEDDSIAFWDPDNGRAIAHRIELEDSVRAIAFSPDNKTLAFARDDGVIRLLDITSVKQSYVLGETPGRIRSLQFSGSGKHLVASSSDGSVYFCDVDSKEIRHTLRPHPDASSPWVAVAITHDGSRLATAGHYDSVKWWDTNSGDEIFEFEATAGFSPKLIFTPDEMNLVVCSESSPISVCELTTGKTVRSFRNNRSQVADIAFLSDGNLLVSCIPFEIWNPKSGQQVDSLAGYPYWSVGRIASASDGTMLVGVSIGFSNTIHFWNPQNDRTSKLLNTRLWKHRQLAHDQRTRNWNSNIFHLQHLLAAEPNDANHWLQRGIANAYLESWKLAEADLQQAKSLGSAAGGIQRIVAYCQFAQGDTKRFQATIKGMLARVSESNSPSEQDITAYTALISDSLDKAVYLSTLELAKNAVAALPDNLNFKETLAAAQYRTGSFKQARDTALTIMSKTKSNPFYAIAFLAMSYCQLNDLENARLWLKKLPNDSPELNAQNRLILKSLRSEADSLLKLKSSEVPAKPQGSQ